MMGDHCRFIWSRISRILNEAARVELFSANRDMAVDSRCKSIALELNLCTPADSSGSYTLIRIEWINNYPVKIVYLPNYINS